MAQEPSSTDLSSPRHGASPKASSSPGLDVSCRDKLDTGQDLGMVAVDAAFKSTPIIGTAGMAVGTGIRVGHALHNGHAWKAVGEGIAGAATTAASLIPFGGLAGSFVQEGVRQALGAVGVNNKYLPDPGDVGRLVGDADCHLPHRRPEHRGPVNLLKGFPWHDASAVSASPKVKVSQVKPPRQVTSFPSAKSFPTPTVGDLY